MIDTESKTIKNFWFRRGLKFQAPVIFIVKSSKPCEIPVCYEHVRHCCLRLCVSVRTMGRPRSCNLYSFYVISIARSC